SQTNSIDSQVKGFEDKTGIILTPCLPPADGVKTPPTLQVEEKGKVKEKEEEQDVEKNKNFDNVLLSAEQCKEKYLSDKKIVKAVCENTKNNISELEIEERLNKFNSMITENGDYSKTFKDYCKHFLSWHKLNRSKQNTKIKTKGFL